MSFVIVVLFIILAPIAACWWVLFKKIKPQLEQSLERFPYCIIMITLCVISVFPGWNLLVLAGMYGYTYFSKNYRT